MTHSYVWIYVRPKTHQKKKKKVNSEKNYQK